MICDLASDGEGGFACGFLEDFVKRREEWVLGLSLGDEPIDEAVAEEFVPPLMDGFGLIRRDAEEEDAAAGVVEGRLRGGESEGEELSGEVLEGERGAEAPKMLGSGISAGGGRMGAGVEEVTTALAGQGEFCFGGDFCFFEMELMGEFFF